MRVVCFLCLMMSASVWSQSVEVRDSLGRRVTLPKPAARVVALAPHIVENVFSAGAGDHLVGVVSYSNYPAAANKIPIVGGYKSFSVEAIVAMKPDLVLMWGSGNGMKALNQITMLDIPVYVDELEELEEVAKSVRDIGILTGNAQRAERHSTDYLHILEKLRNEYSQKTPVTLFYQVWNEPLQTLNGQHIINDVIELCGGENVFSDAKVLAPKVGLESIIMRDPEAIVASGMGEARPEWLDDWQKWPSLAAVQNDNLFFIPPDILQRHTFRILSGAEMLCLQLDSVRDQRQKSTKGASPFMREAMMARDDS